MNFFKFLFVFLISVSSFAGPMQKISSPAEFDKYLNEAHFSGVFLVARDTETLFKKAYGVRDFVTNTPILITDKFQIGSVSKQFTAAAILKLQEEKKLSIDDEIVKYLPEYPAFKGIKIRDILNHTGGVANYTDQQVFWHDPNPNRSYSLVDIAKFIATLPFDFAPTTKWKYSNSGYILAGRIVEVVSGKSWDDYIKVNFLIPLEMNDTGYVEDFKTVSAVVGYKNDGGTGLVPVNMNLSWALSAGGLYSTVDDLEKWTAMYDSSSLLSDESKTQMQTPFLNNYALGLEVVKMKDETRITHGGRTPGFVTDLSYLKKSKLKVIKLDNNDGGVVDPTTVALALFDRGEASALKVNPYPMDASKLQDYVGFFKGDGMNVNIFVQDNVLYLQPDDGQPPYQLFANDKDSFRVMGFAGEEFIRDENNNVIGMKHYQGGGVFDFKKETNPVSAVTFQPLKKLGLVLR